MDLNLLPSSIQLVGVVKNGTTNYHTTSAAPLIFKLYKF